MATESPLVCAWICAATPDASTHADHAHVLPHCSIQALLSAPNPDDPLADNVAKHWKDNEPEAIGTGEQQEQMQHKPMPRKQLLLSACNNLAACSLLFTDQSNSWLPQ